MKYLFLLFFVNTCLSQTAFYNKTNTTGDFKEYITKDNRSIKVGDSIQIKYPYAVNQFVFILQGNTPTGTILVNKKVCITNIKSVGNKNQGYKVWLLFKGYGALPIYIDYEAAKDTNEIE